VVVVVVVVVVGGGVGRRRASRRSRRREARTRPSCSLLEGKGWRRGGEEEEVSEKRK